MVTKTIPNEPYEELNRVYEEYYENGQLKNKGTYKNNVPDGVWEEYDKSGRLKSKTTYKNGEILFD